jgi:hypothetical protein
MGIVLLFVVAPTAVCEDKVKVPFLFSEDDKLPQANLLESIPHSTAIANDQFLNAPMTHLDYMLMMLENRLNAGSLKNIVNSKVTAAFEPNRIKSPPGIKGYARYYPAKGRLLVGYSVDDLGPPRKSMRSTCEELLKEMKFDIPQEPMGFFYHNTVLGVLGQKDYSEYDLPLETVAKSVVHRISLVSNAADQKAIYSLSCQRTSGGEPILYERWSSKLQTGK